HLRAHRRRALRIWQVRAFAAILDQIGRRKRGRAALVTLRRSPILTGIANALLGYRRVYASFAEADAAVTRYSGDGHEHPAEIQAHVDITDVTRESDYAALYYLAPVARDLRHVFDLGGSVGNLFYSYARHLPFAAELVWTVCELPATREAGE